ncbi:MAG: flagellin [Clostridiales bacterium]|jgi:flagellin|nr:flagellin [Clostridiales bacterium]
MIINTNVLALNSHRAMKNVGASQAQASARLSSGLKINSAADDAAGLAISEKMRAQIRGLDMASKNAQDGSSLVQTAEGGLQQIDDMVQRARELTVQAANDTNDEKDRGKIAQEMTNLFEEIDSMADRVEFNGKKLINGSFSAAASALYLQVGANQSQSIQFTIGAMKVSDLGLSDLASAVKSAANAGSWGATGGQIDNFLANLDTAVGKVTDQRSRLGAIQNRLDYTMKSLDISSENLSASESRIRDTDMAKEMMSLTKANVLSSAATSMLSQANQAPQNVLQLLR